MVCPSGQVQPGSGAGIDAAKGRTTILTSRSLLPPLLRLLLPIVTLITPAVQPQIIDVGPEPVISESTSRPKPRSARAGRWRLSGATWGTTWETDLWEHKSGPVTGSPGRLHWVEVPGIEPGSSGVLTGLLRAQLTRSLLGPTIHVSKMM
jgi:hypothetical protein